MNKLKAEVELWGGKLGFMGLEAARGMLRECANENKKRRKEGLSKLNTIRLFRRKCTDYAIFWECYDAMPYSEYLKTKHWQHVSAFVKSGSKCVLCSASGDGVSLHVHHNSYANLGHESPTDLTVLCSDCHREIHQMLDHRRRKHNS